MVNSLKVLEPIASAITEIEGDQAILSDVQRLLSELEDKVGAALPQTPLLKPEERAVLGFLEKRQEFCLKPIHAAAYMLDPKCHDQPYAQSGADWRCLCCYISYGTPPPSRWRESNGHFGKVQIKEWPMERGRGVGISWAYYSSYMVAGFVCIRSHITYRFSDTPNTTNISSTRAQLVTLWQHSHKSAQQAYKWSSGEIGCSTVQPQAVWAQCRCIYSAWLWLWGWWNGSWKFNWIWRWNRTSWLRKQVTIQHTDWKGLNKGL